MDESRLIERLRSVETLCLRAATNGEQTAALRARARLLERIEEGDLQGPWPLFLQLRPSDLRSFELLMAVAKRYGLMPVRLVKRRVMIVVSGAKHSVVEVLLPQFDKASATALAALDTWARDAITRALQGLFGKEKLKVVLLPAQIGDTHRG